jgi:outer membrane scaffolding protein for murein synthesis (MipA/OmpV family)
VPQAVARSDPRRTGHPCRVRLRRAVGRLALALAALPLLTHADEQPLWELGLGAGALRLPHYRGSDQDHDWLLPVPYLVYRGSFLRADREGARAVLLETERVQFDLSLAASLPTRSEDDDARRGMDDLAPTVELGPDLRMTLARGAGWRLDLRAPVRAALTVESDPRSIGWTATPHLRLDLSDLHGWKLGLQAGPVWGSRRYHAYFYEVGPADATARRPAYRAPGGFGGGYALATLSRRFEHVWAGAFLRHDTLHGAAFGDSPLVRDRGQLSFGMALTWVFASSTQRVVIDEH